MRRIRVRVTREHIRRGIRSSPDKCAVALAALDAGYEWTSLSLVTGYLRKGTTILSVRVSRPATAFMMAFDRNEKVRPSTFAFQVTRVTPMKGGIDVSTGHKKAHC